MTKTLTGYDLLVYVNVSEQRHLKRCHICIQNVITERMTLVTNMHKTSFIFITCHDYEGVMLVLCTPLQVLANV